jgi:WD40 repeat protein
MGENKPVLLCLEALASHLSNKKMSVATLHPQAYHPIEAPGMKESVYSVAINADGSRVASGSPDGFVRINDPRAGEKVMKLRGHTANIRCSAAGGKFKLLPPCTFQRSYPKHL